MKLIESKAKIRKTTYEGGRVHYVTYYLVTEGKASDIEYNLSSKTNAKRYEIEDYLGDHRHDMSFTEDGTTIKEPAFEIVISNDRSEHYANRSADGWDADLASRKITEVEELR